MCEANAYIFKNGVEELVMESVDRVEPEGENAWTLVSIFGDQKTVHGTIKAMHLVDHKILFETNEAAMEGDPLKKQKEALSLTQRLREKAIYG